MDTSKEYIKMCEKATEIWEAWNPIQYDYVYIIRRGKHKDVVKVIRNIDITGSPIKEYQYGTYRNITPLLEIKHSKYIWLPRQDQLQDMVKKVTAAELIERFNRAIDFWVECSYSDKAGIDELLEIWEWSMEQLWLAFVMKEKFKKTWAGEEWI